MPILGDRKRADRDRGSFIQDSPSKSPATKIPKSRRNLYENTRSIVDTSQKIWKEYYKNWNLSKQVKRRYRTAKN